MSQNSDNVEKHPVGSTTSLGPNPPIQSELDEAWFEFHPVQVANLIDFEEAISKPDFFKLFGNDEFHEYIKSIFTMKQKVFFHIHKCLQVFAVNS